MTGIIGFIKDFIFMWPILKWLWKHMRYLNVKVAIVCSDYNRYSDIRQILMHEGLYKRNISLIRKQDLLMVKDASRMIVDYPSFTQKEIIKILDDKSASARVVIYCPPPKTSDDFMKVINRPRVTVVNFKENILKAIL